MEMMKNSINTATFQADKALHLYIERVGKINPMRNELNTQKKTRQADCPSGH